MNSCIECKYKARRKVRELLSSYTFPPMDCEYLAMDRRVNLYPMANSRRLGKVQVSMWDNEGKFG